MKKFLQIIAVLILFIASILIFWMGLAPVSFSEFFAKYPKLNETVDKINVLNNNALNLSTATTSEPVLGLSGQVVINNNTWNVEIAKNEQARTNGLSNRTALRVKNGLLFAFDKMSLQAFWMKDMLIPLDMIFFDANWKIVEIDSNLSTSSFPKIFGSTVKSQYVLEINANEAISYGLKVNDQAIFINK